MKNKIKFKTILTAVAVATSLGLNSKSYASDEEVVEAIEKEITDEDLSLENKNEEIKEETEKEDKIIENTENLEESEYKENENIKNKNSNVEYLTFEKLENPKNVEYEEVLKLNEKLETTKDYEEKIQLIENTKKNIKDTELLALLDKIKEALNKKENSANNLILLEDEPEKEQQQTIADQVVALVMRPMSYNLYENTKNEVERGRTLYATIDIWTSYGCDDGEIRLLSYPNNDKIDKDYGLMNDWTLDFNAETMEEYLERVPEGSELSIAINNKTGVTLFNIYKFTPPEDFPLGEVEIPFRVTFSDMSIKNFTYKVNVVEKVNDADRYVLKYPKKVVQRNGFNVSSLMYPQEINTKRTITTNDGVFVYGDDPFDIYGKDKATIEPKKFEFVENAPEFLEIDEKTGIISFKHDAPDEFVNKKLEIKVKVTYEDDSFDYAFSEIYIDENEEDIEKSYMDVNYSYDEVHPFPVDLYWLGNYFEGDDTLKFIYKVYPGVSEGNKFVLKNLDGEVLGELLVDPYNEEEYTEKDVYLVNDWEPLNARIGIIKIKDPSKMGKASDMYRFELEPADKNLKNFDFSSYSGLRLDENGPSFISFPMVYLKPELSDEILTVPINGSLKEFAREPFLTENYERAFYNFFKQADKALYNRIEWVEKPSTKTPGLKYGKVKVTSQFGRVIPYGERYLELPFFDVSILDKNPEELDKYSFEHFGRSERVNYIEHSKWEFEVPILVEFGIKPIEDKEYTEEEKIDEIAVEILRTNITKGKVIAEIKELPEWLTFEYDKEKEIGRITGKSPKINDWKEDEEERNYEITVTAKDEEGNETLETFTIKIKKDKIPPKVTPIDDKTVVEGVEITPIPVTTDDKKAIVTVEGLPDGLTYNKETGQIEGVPTKKDDWGDDKEKEIKVTVKAKDENNNESTPVEFTITLQRDTDGDKAPDVTDKDDEGKSIPWTDIEDIAKPIEKEEEHKSIPWTDIEDIAKPIEKEEHKSIPWTDIEDIAKPIEKEEEHKSIPWTDIEDIAKPIEKEEEHKSIPWTDIEDIAKPIEKEEEHKSIPWIDIEDIAKPIEKEEEHKSIPWTDIEDIAKPIEKEEEHKSIPWIDIEDIAKPIDKEQSEDEKDATTKTIDKTVAYKTSTTNPKTGVLSITGLLGAVAAAASELEKRKKDK